MEIVDLAQDYSTSYSDLAPRDYRKLHNLHGSVQVDKALRLVTQKPQYQYGSGNPPQLPFAPSGSNKEDFFGEMELEDEDFPSPSALIPGYKNTNMTLTVPYDIEKDSSPGDMGYPSHSRGSIKGDARGLPGSAFSFPDQLPGSSFGEDSLDSLETGMLQLEDLMAKPIPVETSPKRNASFIDGQFDFEAFNNGIDSQGSHLSLSAYQPAGLRSPASKHTRQMMKRARSSTPEEDVVKCRRVSKNNRAPQILQQAPEPPQPVYPEWLNEFDQDLINGFKDVVEFID